ncbi:FAD-dependent oxidoreductase, partial [Erwinia sp. MYb416]|uniref:FAD-dependent oxidoreductase n=1 Tax=Erwinia sp. MYb416 TaxID=3108532 RepID=UPI0030A7B5BB
HAELSLVQRGFIEQNGIELRTGRQVVAIDRQRRQVHEADGCVQAYDQLVLASGSSPFVPPIPGSKHASCFVYRTLDDLDSLAAKAAGSTRGIVIGGGLLGLEAANALQKLGLE